MTTSPTPFPSGILEKGTIPVGKIAYFRERLRNRLHEVVFLEFLRQQDAYGLTKAELARRIGKPPERITRLLAAPGNWTLDTVSDLLLGMASELDLGTVLLVNKIETRASDARGIATEISSVRQQTKETRPSFNDLVSPKNQTVSASGVSTNIEASQPPR
jgi:hypothetical protein